MLDALQDPASLTKYGKKQKVNKEKRRELERKREGEVEEQE